MLAISPDLPRLLEALLAKQDIPNNQRSSYRKHEPRWSYAKYGVVQLRLSRITLRFIQATCQ